MGFLGLMVVVTMRKVQAGAEPLSVEFIPEARLARQLNDPVADVPLAVRSYRLTNLVDAAAPISPTSTRSPFVRPATGRFSTGVFFGVNRPPRRTAPICAGAGWWAWVDLARTVGLGDSF